MSEFIFLSDNFGQDIVKSTIALFVVLDPLGIIPLYASITQKLEKAQRTTISKTVIITASLLLFAFAVAGNQIFAIFGISITSFMIAGSILLFIVAIELLTHGSWRYDNSDIAAERGVVPIAFPLLAGPGAITTVIISFQTTGLVVTTLSILITIGITYAILLNSNRIFKVLGTRGSIIVTRVFAVILAAIAVQFMIQGIREEFLT